MIALSGSAASSGAEMRIKPTASVSCIDTKYLHLRGSHSRRFSLEHFVCWRRKSSCETLRWVEIVTECYERLIFALEADQLIKVTAVLVTVDHARRSVRTAFCYIAHEQWVRAIISKKVKRVKASSGFPWLVDFYLAGIL